MTESLSKGSGRRVVVLADEGVTRLGLRAIIERMPEGFPVDDADPSSETVAPDIAGDPPAVGVLATTQAVLILGLHAERAPFVAVVDSPTDNTIVALLAAGARGLVLKDSAQRRLPEALRSVLEGGLYLDPGVTHAVVARVLTGRRARGPFGLTAREQRVMSLMTAGASNPEIARQLEISTETVRTHVRNIVGKLGAVDRIQAVTIAREYHL